MKVITNFFIFIVIIILLCFFIIFYEYINIEKDQMFFDKILPIIKEDEANLNEILIILIDEYLK